jgi:ABC-type sulfate/molybdate transport systems ATPase subunit
LNGVDLTLPPGDVVIFGGRSGCGKSTLLELCAGLIKPGGGAILWDGDDITEASRYELYGRRREIGYVFQGHALIANHSAFDNIALPLKCGGADLSSEAIGARVRSLMRELNISRDVEKRFPEALSAAQLKCVAVARALIAEPRLLILDEPFSGIDPVTANLIAGVLHKTWKRDGMSILMAAHSFGAWPEHGARHFMLKGGRLESADEAFARVRSLRYNRRYDHGTR